MQEMAEIVRIVEEAQSTEWTESDGSGSKKEEKEPPKKESGGGGGGESGGGGEVDAAALARALEELKGKGDCKSS